MGGFLSRFFDVRANEGAAVLRLTATLAGLVAAHTMLETARDALFLGRLAANHLTFVYAALAVLALITAAANGAFVARFGRRNALVFSLLGSAYGTIVLYLVPTSSVVVFGLYLWSGLIGAILVAQFWMLAGQIFTVAQGKRLFGLIAAGGVVGAVVGASMSVAVLRFVDVQELVSAAGALFLLTALIVTTIPVDEIPRRRPSAARWWGKVFGEAEDFRRTPYLSRLALIIAVSTSAVLCTDYLFKSFAAEELGPTELAPFFARYYALLNILALVTQVALSGALVRRAGVLTAFSVLPSLLFGGGIALLLTGTASMTGVLLLKGADGSLRHSLHRITTELLWMPLPDDVKARSKAYVDTVVVRGAQAATAGALFALAWLGLDNPSVRAGTVVALSIAWLTLAVAHRRPYLDLFRRALARTTTTGGAVNLNIESVAVVVEALSSRDPDRAIAAIDVLQTNRQQHVIPALILYHEAPEVLIRALEVITTPNRKDWRPLAERLLEHRLPTIRVAALRALARVGESHPLERRLLDIDPSVRAQAAFWLARTKEGTPEHHPAVRQILDMDTLVAPSAFASLCDAIATAGDERWANVLYEIAKKQEGDPNASECLAAAMHKVGDDRFIPLLIGRLRFRVGRETVQEAIAEHGAPALEKLERALKDRELPRRVRRHVPMTIALFTSQPAADILLSHLQVERNGLIRFKTLRALEKLVVEAPIRLPRRRVDEGLHRTLTEYLRLLSLLVPVQEGLRSAQGVRLRSGELLVGLLEDKLSQAQDRAFRYLHLVNRSEDLRGAAIAIRSPDRKLRAQALEYLDVLTVDAAIADIRPLLRLVADDLTPQERLTRARPYLDGPPHAYHDALSRLVRDPDDSVASIAAYHALLLNTSGLADDVRSVSVDRPTLSDLQRIVDHLGRSEVPSVA